ncbi:hypothetical protein D9M70_504380 [compost metagenome]
MSNEQARRASGAANEAARRNIGKTNEASRRAIDQRMQAERRGQAIQDDLNSLIRPERNPATLRPVEARGAVPVQRGSAPWVPPTTTGGIAGPLTEQPGTREYYENEVILNSAQTAFVVVRRAPKKLTVKDGNGDDLDINLERE